MLVLKVILTILLAVCLVVIIRGMKEMRDCSKLMERNDEVAAFRLSLLNLATDYITRRLEEFPDLKEMGNPYIWFVDKYTYDEMLYSKKPLVLEEWYTKEEINKIKS